MKNLSGKELMRNDAVIALIAPGVVEVGHVQQFYDRNGQIRISGYPLNVNAADTVLAQDAWMAYVEPLLAKRKADAEAAAAQKTPPVEVPKTE